MIDADPFKWPFCAIFVLAFLCRLAILPPVVLAQPARTSNALDLAFKHLTIDDGLSQGMVLAIHQDRQGFMWFGTKDGLNRYDGYRFTVFRNDPFDSTSLSNNFIQTIFEDRRGRLWIGTTDGLNCFDPETEKFRRFLHDPDDPHSLSGNSIYAICEAPAPENEAKGITVLWIGTLDGGLNKLVLRENDTAPKGEERGARPSPFTLRLSPLAGSLRHHVSTSFC